MSWFDQSKNSTGKLTTRLSHDAAQVQGVSKLRYSYNIINTVASYVGMRIAVEFANLMHKFTSSITMLSS